jgi:RES domain-containing protein
MVGQSALYLALDPMTAMLEVTQGFANRLHPLLLCEYEVDCDHIADLRSEPERADHGVTAEQMAAPWLVEQRAGKIAASQLVARKLFRSGYAGALVPSYAPGAGADDCNLVLWQWRAELPHKVAVFDPTGRLPKDQVSWG